ncbi:transcriptional regulator [Skermanella stibiiresistens SB22]|uniref:Transcriptional regulator n=1 Tax=Skermanella stibiiresistens SB22 TaxID=1385369 RepID=W9H8B7_9PROT|nr:response regulator transcription factor [Skermanella stibiiresistens]EWY40043.1 transcriptional regulator [Skermanella stibiiresistens SB22]
MTEHDTILIEPNRLFREGIKHLLADSPFHLVSEYASIQQAVEAESVKSKLVIVDYPVDADETLSQLRAGFPDARIVVLASELSADRLKAAMGAGADGYLLKDVSPEALIQSLQLVVIGEKVFPTNLAALLLTQISAPAPQGSWRGLSGREREILQHLVMGASNKLIANKLGITEATVKVHLKTLLRKIDVNNRTQAAIWAMNNGITPEQSMSGDMPATRRLQAVPA